VFELGYHLTLISCMKKRCCDEEIMLVVTLATRFKFGRQK
jgi:hypothetical protein